MDDDMHPVTVALVVILGGSSLVISTWMTVVAFVGGTMPVIGWQTDGGIGTGLVWLFVVDPVVLTVCYWLALVITVPVAALLDRGGDDR